MMLTNDGKVRVQVDVDPRSWWRLAGIAELQGLTVEDYLAELATNGGAVPPPTITKTVVDRIREMHAARMSNGAIALELGLSKESVRRRVLALQKEGSESSVAS